MSAINIDRTKIAMTSLRRSPDFVKFVQHLEDVLDEERDLYETQEASDYKRGRVSVLKEIVSVCKKDK